MTPLAFSPSCHCTFWVIGCKTHVSPSHALHNQCFAFFFPPWPFPSSLFVPHFIPRCFSPWFCSSSFSFSSRLSPTPSSLSWSFFLRFSLSCSLLALFFFSPFDHYFLIHNHFCKYNVCHPFLHFTFWVSLKPTFSFFPTLSRLVYVDYVCRSPIPMHLPLSPLLHLPNPFPPPPSLTVRAKGGAGVVPRPAEWHGGRR